MGNDHISLFFRVVSLLLSIVHSTITLKAAYKFMHGFNCPDVIALGGTDILFLLVRVSSVN